MKILVLCHGNKTIRKYAETCNTSVVDISKADLLDMDPKCKPDILHDLRKPLDIRKRYDIITTMCCDTSAFFDGKGYRVW